MTARRIAVLLPLVLVAAGCGRSAPAGADASPHALGASDPPWVPGRSALPPPDTDRMNYDERTRTLTLYDLPASERWLIRLPGEKAGRPVPSRHRLPNVTDPSQVLVYYTRPGCKASVPVTLRQIRDSGNAHISLGPR